MIQSPYVIKLKRDVAMTFTTYIANSGGLLGLCLGFSLMSGIEIIFCLFWFCGEFKKKATSKQNKPLSLQVKVNNQKTLLSVEKQNSINIVEEELQCFQNNHNSTSD